MVGHDGRMSPPQNDPVRNLPLVKPPQPGEKRVAGWQVAATAIAAIVIVSLFLWGVNNQREETTAGQQATAPRTTLQGRQEPQAQNQQPGNAAATTGQSSNDNRSQGENAGQTSTQQPTIPAQNGQPTENNGQPSAARAILIGTGRSASRLVS
jgi:hypothetical protein